MNTPDRIEQMAEQLRGAGYTVEATDAVYERMATQVRAAGYTVTKGDPAADKAARDEQARTDNAGRQAPADTGITPNGPDDADTQATTARRAGRTRNQASTTSENANDPAEESPQDPPKS